MIWLWVTDELQRDTSAVGISQEIVHSIPTEDLNIRKLSVRCLRRLLTVYQKHTRQNMSSDNRNLFETNSDKFLLTFATIDET